MIFYKIMFRGKKIATVYADKIMNVAGQWCFYLDNELVAIFEKEFISAVKACND